MDYRDLLVKYMAHVMAVDGLAHLPHNDDEAFSLDERDELVAIKREAITALGALRRSR